MLNPRLLIVALVFAPLTGCEWMKTHWGNNDKPKPAGTGPLPPVQPEQLVNYINERAERLQSLHFGDARLVARSDGMPLPALRGSLAASQPRNFRMSATGSVGGKVDLGSNTDQFWVYADAPTVKPMFVYASHSDFETGRAKIPGGIPFEPDWVMQALGMATLPPGNQYRATADEKTRTYTLSWPTTTPNGIAIVKEVVFEGEPAAAGRPQIKRHVVRDTRGKVICSAEVKRAETVAAPLPIQYPTLVVLRWEEQKFEMELELKTGRVNQPFSAEEAGRLFKRPTIGGTPAIDLAGGVFK